MTEIDLMTESDPRAATPHLVALEQCGLELQAPHLRTTTKRRIETADVDVATLSSDSLRFTGWDPEAIVAVFPGLHPAAAYEVEATYLCERGVERVQSMTSGELELHPAIELAKGTATAIRVAIPPAAYADGALELRVQRVRGPDAVMSELRLFSSEPPTPILTVVGDSRGNLVGTVALPDSSAVAGAVVRVAGDAGTFDVTADAAGIFRVPLDGRLPRGRDGAITVATGSDGASAELMVDTRHLARGLRELPPAEDRLDLAGEWGYRGGPFDASDADPAGDAVARVPGHVIFDGLVPENGVGTFRRTFALPVAWAGRAVFLRCDGAYGRAEVRVNGALAGVHGSGATSFDVDLTPFFRAGENDLAITLTEYTPQSVLDDMAWYAHMSLLGIWRDCFLYATPLVQLEQLEIDADWDPDRRVGTLRLGVDAINLDRADRNYALDVTLRDFDGAVVLRESRRGTVAAGSSGHEAIVAEGLTVEPWSAEEPRLYDLAVDLAVDGAPAHRARRRIGFRRVEVRGDQLLVNGVPIRIRGVNRHDSRILQGRALSADQIREDVVHLRQANVNVIRTSHYPPSPHLLDACDELGMFVFEQPPICFSGGFDDHHWNRTNEAAQLLPYVLEVTAETIHRDRGRASVIVWDLGNESRWGPAFDAQLALVRAVDPGRPTIFSYDLNGVEGNVLPDRPAAERPDLRSYHYPGWDATWVEELAWLGSHDQPVVLDEYAPLFAPCLRGAGEAYGLAIDPGIRDYWGAGYQPFMEAALGERGVIGGLIWAGFGDVFAIPLDLTIGQGPWAHLPVGDYVRTRDHYPVEPGVFRRGDGDWGMFDAWNRPRPELWHVHEMYAPIAIRNAAFDSHGSRLEVDLVNRFSHRSFEGLEVRLAGGRFEGEPDLKTRPGQTAHLVVGRTEDSEDVRLEVWHPEGWLIAGAEWPWPTASRTPRELALDRALPLELRVGDDGSLALIADGRQWLSEWPELHVLDVDEPHIPVLGARADAARMASEGADVARAPLVGDVWEGTITARIEDRTVIFEYDCSYTGARSFRAKEVGLTLRPSPELRDLWWRRNGEWSIYPPTHIGRPAGYAAGRPGANTTLDPAPTWEQEATAAGSNDYRSVKRRIVVGGATDGRNSLTVLSDGGQHLRAELVDGAPRLHVLDWYGGIRTLEGNHPIWSAYFGTGLQLGRGTNLRGRVILAAGAAPAISGPAARRAPRS